MNLRTLQRWVREGRTEPDWTTQGHMRWDVDRLLQAIKRLPRDEADEWGSGDA